MLLMWSSSNLDSHLAKFLVNLDMRMWKSRIRVESL